MYFFYRNTRSGNPCLSQKNKLQLFISQCGVCFSQFWEKRQNCVILTQNCKIQIRTFVTIQSISCDSVFFFFYHRIKKVIATFSCNSEFISRNSDFFFTILPLFSEFLEVVRITSYKLAVISFVRGKNLQLVAITFFYLLFHGRNKIKNRIVRGKKVRILFILHNFEFGEIDWKLWDKKLCFSVAETGFHSKVICGTNNYY